MFMPLEKRRTRLRHVLLSAWILILLVAEGPVVPRAATAAARGAAGYYLSIRGYELAAPPGWMIAGSTRPEFEVLLLKPGGTFAPRLGIAIHEMAEEPTPEDIRRETRRLLTRRGYQLLASGQTTVNGEFATVITSRLRTGRPARYLWVRDTLVFRGPLLYQLHFVSAERSAAVAWRQWSQALSAIRWTE